MYGMDKEQIKNIIEALLMTAERPMTVSDLLKLFELETEQPERSELRDALTTLQEDYQNRGMELVEVASGFRIQVREDYSDWVNRLFDEKPARYSRALLETLAIIAYRQPITRGEIEDIRGVSVSSNIIKTLLERGWVRIVGHRDVPGKPGLIATTKEFLDYFNLKKLSELPSLAEIKDFDQMNPDLFEGIDMGEAGKVEEGAAEELSENMDLSSEEVEPEDIQSDEEPEEDDSVEEESDNVIPFTG